MPLFADDQLITPDGEDALQRDALHEQRFITQKHNLMENQSHGIQRDRTC